MKRTLDSVALYTPNNTNTHRYGINSSLIYDLNADHHFRLAYSLDYARHRQTAEFSPYDNNLNPLNVFGGKLKGQPIDVPLANLNIPNFALRSEIRTCIATDSTISTIASATSTPPHPGRRWLVTARASPGT